MSTSEDTRTDIATPVQNGEAQSGIAKLHPFVLSVAGALVVGAITQSVLLYSQAQVTNERLDRVADDLGKVEGQLDAMQRAAGDRWTQSDHKNYAERMDQKLDVVRRDLAEHEREPWHTQAGAEHSESKRRIERLERESAELRERVRDLEKAKEK